MITTMKKIFFIALFSLCMASATNAQGKYKKPQDMTTVQEEKPRRGLFDKDKTPIDKKYLEGACPMVGNKIVWQKYFYADDKTAKEIYDIMLKFLQKMTKEEGQTKKSDVAAVNEEEYQIGARFVEKMVFQNSALSLDHAVFSYQLLVYCIDGRCEVVMKNMNYIYEADRDGGGQFPAEDMLADDIALNKKKDGFHIGGYKKFRMKTIDRKDEIFTKISRALKQSGNGNGQNNDTSTWE